MAPKYCPNCGSTNNDPAEGGTKRCFHCGDCGWIACAKMCFKKDGKVLYRRKKNVKNWEQNV